MAGRNTEAELYVTCPYDPNHKLAPRRVAYHLDKCAQTSKKKLCICKYNSLHRIEPVLLEHHYAAECPDKKHYDDGWGDIIAFPVAQQPNDVGDLADALGAAAISDSTAKPSTSASDAIDWDVGEPKNFLAPEFDGSMNVKPTGSFTMNKIKVQKMTKSQRKQFYSEQLANNLADIEKDKKQQEMAKKQLEMEKRRQQELEEKAAIEKEKREIEERRQANEKKRKEKKAREKAAKRAAYLAKIEQEKQT